MAVGISLYTVGALPNGQTVGANANVSGNAGLQMPIMGDISSTAPRAERLSGPPLLRLAHPLAFAGYVNKLGGPANRIFRRSGLPALCDNPNVFVPVRFAWEAFDLAAKSEASDIGWRVGRFVHENQLNGALLRRFDSAPTLYRGLHEFVRLISSEASDLKLGIVEQDEDILLYTHYPGSRDIAGYHTSQAYQMPVYLSVIRHFLGPAWLPAEIGIEAKRVPDVAKTMFGGARIRTGTEFGYIRIPRDLLLTPAHSRSEASAISRFLLTKDLGYIDRLRVLLVPYLAEGYPGTRLAATLMDTSQRTLARRLSDANITYQALIDEIRFSTATELLRESTKNIGEIASAVGFTDQAHFTRMFRRIGGITPRAYRLSIARH